MINKKIRNRIIKIIVTNISLIILVVIGTELLASSIFDHFNYYYPPEYFSINNDFRYPAIYPESEGKKDIVIAGCSFTYGDKLNTNEIFSSILSNFTHRNVYNIGLSGGSPRDILYILNNTEILNKLIINKTNIEYFIYTYIYDHKRRLYSNTRPTVPFFIPIKNYKKLQYIYLPLLINHSYIINYINYFLYNKGFFVNKNKLFKLYMQEIKNKIKSVCKSSEFIILVYDYEVSDIQMFTELEKAGFKVIYLDKILNFNINDDQYQVPDKFHPNAKAWQVIVPALAKELNL